MKKSTALAIALASQAVVSFAGPPPPKEVVPAPPPPPASYFRPNEFDIGAFATYATWTGNNVCCAGSAIYESNFRGE